MTIREALAEGTARLRSADPGTARVDTPALDASLLLAEVLGTSRAGLAASGPDPAPEEALGRFGELLERRLSGECVAYILGRKEFRALLFTVTPSVLVPRPDTETLVETALKALEKFPAPRAPLSLLDLCTGCGAVAVSLKNECPALEVWASDISTYALECAEANARRLLGAGKINFIHGDLFAGIAGRFTLITANPPYIPSGDMARLAPEVRKEPRLALDGGVDGLEIIRRIAAEAGAHLAPGGTLLVETDGAQAEAVRALLDKAGFLDIQSYRDLDGQERVTGGTKPGFPGDHENGGI
jgi:release factor glutamine methyltransferase